MAVRVDEDVGGLEVPVDELGGVQILHAPEYLVHDEAVMDILEYLLADGVVQICLHVLEDQVQVLVVVGTQDIVQLYYILVAQLMQVANLPVRALGVDRVLEGIEDLLQRKGRVTLTITHLPHVAVCSRTHLL